MWTNGNRNQFGFRLLCSADSTFVSLVHGLDGHFGLFQSACAPRPAEAFDEAPGADESSVSGEGDVAACGRCQRGDVVGI